MKKIKLEKLVLQNFKGCTDRTVEFSDRTMISGANTTGKTTILDGFMWLLFNKDSAGAEKFHIRPLDADGQQIDNVEIMVEGTLTVDGKEIVLKKVQRQIWRKRRGTDVTELQGNENLFEINGYPKSEKDYKEYISDLLEEKMFKLLTNPKAFTALPWKEQRAVLMCLVDDVSDVAIAESDSRFAALVPELEQASPDDIRKKYTKVLNKWKDRQEKIPTRIDEASKQRKDIDVAERELHANYLREQIADAERQYEDADSAVKEFDRVNDRILEVKGEMRMIYDVADRQLQEQAAEIRNRKDSAHEGFNESRQQIRMCELDIERVQAAIEKNEAEKKRLQDEWKAEKAKMFPAYESFPEFDGNICHACGQALPEGKRQENLAVYEERKRKHLADYEKSKEIFEASRKERLAQITEKGNATVADIKKYQKEMEQLKADLEKAKANSIRFNKMESDAMSELDKLALKPDLSDNQEYEALQLELSRLEESIKSMNTGADYRSQLRIRLSGLREELSVVEKEIASADNTALEERITELQTEQREVGQKVADQERMICMLESFVRAKMDKVSEVINAKFNTVSWKLFDMQINGGMKETCECTVNGVPYSSLNNGHQIIAGLDIIVSLASLYGVTAPVFIDNAEALNDFNIPDMDGQMVLLKVSDDAELKVRA